MAMNSLQKMYIEMVEKALDRYVSRQRCNDDHVLEAMRYAVLGGQPAARAYLAFISLRQGYAQPGGYHGSLQGGKHHRLVERSPQVHSRAPFGFVGWQRISRAVYYVHSDFFHCSDIFGSAKLLKYRHNGKFHGSGVGFLALLTELSQLAVKLMLVARGSWCRPRTRSRIARRAYCPCRRHGGRS